MDIRNIFPHIPWNKGVFLPLEVLSCSNWYVDIYLELAELVDLVLLLPGRGLPLLVPGGGAVQGHIGLPVPRHVLPELRRRAVRPVWGQCRYLVSSIYCQL